MSRFFEDIEVGERLTSPRRTLTARDIENYSDLSGDWRGHWSSIFADEAQLDATRLGDDRMTAPEVLVMSQQYGLRPTTEPHEPHTGIVALFEWEEITYRQPLRVGDSFYYEHEVLDKHTGRPGYGTIRTRRTIRNQRDEIVMTIVERTRYRTRAMWEQTQQAASRDQETEQ